MDKKRKLNGEALKSIGGGTITVTEDQIILRDDSTGEIRGYFPNTEEGYKQAMAFARILHIRTAPRE